MDGWMEDQKVGKMRNSARDEVVDKTETCKKSDGSPYSCACISRDRKEERKRKNDRQTERHDMTQHNMM